MILVYNLSIQLLSCIYWLASFFNDKAKLFVSGRKDLLKLIEQQLKQNASPTIWIHCASLGEFEQGRPIIEALKKEKPHYKIVLTFFSPSGYEIRKGYSLADWIFYLPWDTKKNANAFVKAIRPSLAIFVKYEFWHHYTSELKKRNIPIISVASIFRPSQLFFKSYGSFYRSILKKFSFFFVQNYVSKDLLKSIDINQIEVAGDTRFDRVNTIVQNAEHLTIIESFKNQEKVLVAGSVWLEDMDVLAPFINEHGSKVKTIIAPHEINEESISAIEKLLQQKCIRYSKVVEANVNQYAVLIIDNIGMLSRLYRYGEYAFIGGAFGKGLHNILEAACYGVPIFFGDKNFQKFQEANDLINRGGAFEVKDYSDFIIKYETVSVPENFVLACEVTKLYVKENLGATEKIMTYCRKVLTA